jgi:hypothetical protein
MAFCGIFLWLLNQVSYNKVWNICVWKQDPWGLPVSESKIVDTTDWSKLHDDEKCNIDLSQNVSWMSNQERSDEHESREVRVTLSAEVLEAIYVYIYTIFFDR